MSADRRETIVRAPAPYLPVGRPAAEVIDLGCVLRDELFTRECIADVVRPALHARLAEAAEAEELALAAELVRAFLDSWPLAHLVDESRDAWIDGEFGGATIPTLARASRLIALAHPDWSTSDAGDWPQPDAVWIRARAGAGPHVVVRRHEDDDAEHVASALRAEIAEGVEGDPGLDFPPVLRVDGAELAARRAKIGGALAAGEYDAVQFTRPVPDDVDSRLALAEVRLEGRGQRALERYGPPGLLAPDAPLWPEFVPDAPAGREGSSLHPVAESILLPGPSGALARGTPGVAGYVYHNAALRWVAVEPAAVEVLQALAREPDPARLASELGAPADALRAICDELVRAGAATAM